MSALLSLQNVSVTLKRRVLESTSLELDAGEIFALLGSNGAGKTTLIRAALGIVPAEGVVRLGGDDPIKLSARQRALRAAYLPQRPQAIWPVSVDSLVALGRYAHGAAPDKLGAQDQAAVDTAIEACGLATLRTRRMDEISGGEKARAHLARALAQHAKLLVLDEPTAGLDPAQALSVAKILRTHAKAGGAVLFATHDVTLAANVASHVLLMLEGRIIAAGAPTEALTPQAIEQAYAHRGRLERIGDSAVAVFD